MAKQYIVKTTIHGMAKKGDKKVVIKRSAEPQDVPASLVKELLASGVIEEVAGKGRAHANVSQADGPGSGAGDDDTDATGEGDGASGD
ncbi:MULTISPECIES: hypothetical protein [Stutzerimonas stutzeri subgroup]|uniref:hypothetical protein n=1 Tax=Stutzerimonas stutzeri subgroup TaxID=578833 RepID=UPI00289F404A|nr:MULTISPECIES: hypothetical protein [Stutzerimonas stutzeri subgroup]